MILTQTQTYIHIYTKLKHKTIEYIRLSATPNIKRKRREREWHCHWLLHKTYWLLNKTDWLQIKTYRMKTAVLDCTGWSQMIKTKTKKKRRKTRMYKKGDSYAIDIICILCTQLYKTNTNCGFCTIEWKTPYWNQNCLIDLQYRTIELQQCIIELK